MFKKLLVGIIGVATLALSACNGRVKMGHYADADKYVVGSQTYEGAVNNINIDWISGEITLIEDESINGVKIEEVNELNDKEKVHSYFHDKTVDIKFMESGLSAVINKEDKKLTVTYHPGLENLNIDLTSGTINADKLTVNKIVLDYTSGKCVVGEAICETFNCDFTSGSLEISSLDVKNYKCKYTSGNIMTRFHSLENADIDFTSGRAILSTPEKGATISVDKTSGKLEVKREHVDQDGKIVIGDGSAIIDIDFTSGEVYVY